MTKLLLTPYEIKMGGIAFKLRPFSPFFVGEDHGYRSKDGQIDKKKGG